MINEYLWSESSVTNQSSRLTWMNSMSTYTVGFRCLGWTFILACYVNKIVHISLQALVIQAIFDRLGFGSRCVGLFDAAAMFSANCLHWILRLQLQTMVKSQTPNSVCSKPWSYYFKGKQKISSHTFCYNSLGSSQKLFSLKWCCNILVLVKSNILSVACLSFVLRFCCVCLNKLLNITCRVATSQVYWQNRSTRLISGYFL